MQEIFYEADKDKGSADNWKRKTTNCWSDTDGIFIFLIYNQYFRFDAFRWITTPQGTTKFQTSWLSATDCTGQTLRGWCRRGKDDFHVYCRLCDVDFKYDNYGKS